MKKLLILPALIFCSFVFAGNNNKSKNKKIKKPVEQKTVKLRNEQHKTETVKGTPVVTYKTYKVERRGSKQIVPVE